MTSCIEFHLGVLPPTAKVGKLEPLGRTAAKRGAYQQPSEGGDAAPRRTRVGRALRAVAGGVASPCKGLARRGVGLLRRVVGAASAPPGSGAK